MGKIKYGISNVHYAVATDDGTGHLTYGEVKKLPGAVSLSMDAEGDTIEEFADNVSWYNDIINNGYAGTLELESLPEEFESEVFGRKKGTKGGILETDKDQTKEVALLWQFEIGGDSTVKGKRGLLYRVKFSRNGESGETKEKTIKPNHVQLKFSATPRINDGHVKYSAKTGDEVYAKWFEQVTEITE